MHGRNLDPMNFAVHIAENPLKKEETCKRKDPKKIKMLKIY